MIKHAGSSQCDCGIPRSIEISIIQHEAIVVKAVRPLEIFGLYSTPSLRGRKVLTDVSVVKLDIVDRIETLTL